MLQKVIFGLTALSLTAAVPPNQQVVLEPAGPWRIEYTQDECLVGRSLKSGSAAYTLVASLEPLQASVWLRLRGPEEIRRFDDEEIALEVDGVPLPEKVHMNVKKAQSSGSIREFQMKRFRDQIGLASRTLRFSTRRHGDLLLNGMDWVNVSQALATCVADLHDSLGIKPETVAAIKIWPEGHSGSFVNIPEQAQFTYKILYWVTADGRVDECRLLGSSGNADFDKSACTDLKKKGKFTPARDASGAKVRAPVYENANMLTTVVMTN